MQIRCSNFFKLIFGDELFIDMELRRWRGTLKFYFLLLLLTCALAKLKKERERKKVVKMKSESDNLCTIVGTSAPFHCFCSDGSASNATKAKCWVFSGLTAEHSFWTLFSTQPFIRELNLMVTPMGQLNFLPTSGLQYLTQLQTLTILYGNISDIHAYALANLTKVHEVRLAKNQIITLSQRAFAHLTNLSVLDLEENRIVELNRNVFFDLPLLSKLLLKLNNISAIQEGAFRQLGQLVELDLSANAISVLTKDVFAGLLELKKLFLRYNKIVMLGDLTFAELWILEELDLEGNLIELISDRAFAGLTHLFKLNLSYNKLKTLRSNLLDSVPAIMDFDLRHNELETLTLDNVKPILHNFHNGNGHFYLADNKFVCDCRLAWMHALRNEAKGEKIREALDKLTCHLQKADGESSIKPHADAVLNRRPNTSTGLDYAGEDVDDTVYYDDDDEDEQPQKSSPENLRRVLEIPPSELPCANASTTQAPRILLNTPSYAEINSNSGAICQFYTVLSCCIFMLVGVS
ncbi:connectin-like isoform X1 [Photinus pyralis]|uniref:LRRCT domain-containing protein n=2 Tax=Photinus pyralis TaxID=7054 RepID=A0A1Y1MUR2_PHOPY|nr:connectin-like isoform X1 [Photinus pyralis]